MTNQFNKKYFEENYLKHNKSYKYTYFMISFLIFMYFVQFFVIGVENLEYFMLNTKDLFSGIYHTVFTALFFHVDIFHIFFNLIALFLFSRHVEKHFGGWTILIFLICGTIANIISSIIAYTLGDIYYSIGASSGIAALVILALLLEPLSITTILGWIFIFLDIIGLSNQQSSTNHLAHIGGYLSLFFLIFFLEYKNRKKIYLGFLINLFLLIILYLILEYFEISFIGF